MNERSCPACGSTDVTVRSKNKGFLCEDCDHRWPVAGPESPTTDTPAGSVSPPADTLSTLVLERYPFPIAWGYRSMLESKTASWAVDCAFYAYTSVLRLTALIFLAQFLQSQTRQCEKAAIALQYLRRPSLEGWFHVLNTLCKHVFLPQQDRQGGFPTFSEGGPFAADLVLAAKQFSKLQRNGLKIHERLRDLRNERAHDSPWDEAECGRRLPEIRELLDVVLHTFIPVASITVLRQSPNGVVVLIGGQEFFTEQKCNDARMEDLFVESSTILRNHDDDLLPLYPLFLSSDEPLPQGFTEPLLVFGGHGKETALYLGVRSRSERQDTLARYQDLLRAKNIDPGFDYRKFDPWSVSQWAKETSLGLVNNLKGVKYFPDFYQVRLRRSPQGATTGGEPAEQIHGVDDAIRRWLDHGREVALMVAADAGMGKTSLFCRLAEDLLTSADSVTEDPVQETCDNNDCVLLLLGGALRDDTSLFGRIRDGLGFFYDPKTMARRFDELLTAWQQQARQQDADHEQRRLIILLDAVNEAQDAKKLLQEVAELASMAAACNKRLGRQFVRLLVSVRTERLFVLLDRWNETGSSGHFLDQPRNFAHFPDLQGEDQPWLCLRPFTEAETRGAFQATATALASSCPAPWEQLAPKTRTLLRHPLMVLLFHQAFAGQEYPPSTLTEAKVWDAWLDRSFAASQGRKGSLKERVLALADICIDQGYEQIPESLADQWHCQWQERLGNDPVRIAAGMDDLERMVESGFLRKSESGGLDWLSDSLAEQVIFRALQRRDPAFSEVSLTAWLQLPQTARFDGALTKSGEIVFAINPSWLHVFLPSGDILAMGDLRSCLLLARILEQVAPLGTARSIQAELARYGQKLQALCGYVLQENHTSSLERLYFGLMGTGINLNKRLGASPALHLIHAQGLEICERMVELEPDNTSYQSFLAYFYRKMGEIEVQRDSEEGRSWYGRALEIRERLVALEPEDSHYQFELLESLILMGSVEQMRDPEQAGRLFERALEISDSLVALEPENTHYLFSVSMSLHMIGCVEELRNPELARRWYVWALEIMERLVTQEPLDTNHLRGLSTFYLAIGKIEELGDPKQARNWYGQALEISESLVALEPEDASNLRYLSASYLGKGRMEEQHDPEQAKRLYESGLKIHEQLVVLEPENTVYLFDLFCDCIGMGEIEERRDLEQARSWYGRALEIIESLVALEPDTRGYLYNLSVSCERMGDMEKTRDPELAGRWYERALEISERLVALEPENTQYLRDLSISCDKMGDLDGRRDPEQARKWYAKGLAICERLRELEPENTEYLRDLSVSCDKMGDLDGRRDPEQARKWYAKGLAIHERLRELEPENTEYLRDLSVSCDKMGDLDGRRDPEQARKWYAKGLAIHERLRELEPENTEYLRDLSVSCDKMGDLDGRRDPEQARKWYAKGLAIHERLRELEPENTQYLNDCLSSCHRLAATEREDAGAAIIWWRRGSMFSAHMADLLPNIENKKILCQWLLQVAIREQAANPQVALQGYQRALKILQELIREYPEDAMLWNLVAFAQGLIAQFYQDQGDPTREHGHSVEADVAMQRAVALKPEDADIQYGLACTRARLGKEVEALTALTRSVELGNTDADHAEQDKDLASLRDLPTFQALLVRMRDVKAE